MKPQDAPTDLIDTEADRSTNSSQPGFTTRVGRAFVWTQLLRIVEVGTSVLFLVFVIRKLGPTEYGIFGVIMSVTAAGNMLATFGFSETLSKYIPELARNEKRDATIWIAQRILAVGLLLALLCCAALWIFRERVAGMFHYPGMSGLYPVIAALVISQTLVALLSAMNIGLWRAGTVFAITGLVNVLAAVGAICLVYLGRATGEAAASAAAVAFLLGMAAFVVVSRRWIFGRPRLKTDMKPIWRFSASAWIVRLSLFAMGSNVVVILICWLLGSRKEVAFFNCAYVPLFRLQALILGWSVSVLPSLAELRAKLGASSLVVPYRIYVKLTVAVAAPTFVFVAWYAGSLITGLFGVQFARAAVSLRVYAILSLIALLAGSGLTTNLLYTLGKARAVGFVRAATAVAHLGLSCWLILRYGALGAVIGIGLAAIVAACVEIGMAPASTRSEYPLHFIAKALVASTGCIAVMSRFLPVTVVGLAFGGTAYFILYAFLLARWRPLDDNERELLGRHPNVARILTVLGV